MSKIEGQYKRVSMARGSLKITSHKGVRRICGQAGCTQFMSVVSTITPRFFHQRAHAYAYVMHMSNRGVLYHGKLTVSRCT